MSEMIALIRWKPEPEGHLGSRPKYLPEKVNLPLYVEAEMMAEHWKPSKAKYYVEKLFKWPTDNIKIAD